MKKTTALRMISLILVLIFALSAFIGCSKNEETEETQQTVNTTPTEDDGFVKDDLPATMDFDGKEVQ